MKLLLQHLLFVFVLSFHQQVSNAQQPVDLAWDTSGCLGGYDACATIEFCEGQQGSFGFRVVGEQGCGLTTAPVIRMDAGKKYMLTLNNVASEPTNLHTHGFHISGDGNSDDVSRHVEPNGCLSYTYDIDVEHRGGTLWYHAHHHQYTKNHVEEGALGMLIVTDQASQLPNDAGVIEFATDINSELKLIGAKLGNGGNTFGNGLQPATLNVIQNKWYRLRFVAVEPSAGTMTLAVTGGSCDAHAVAYDGVWRSIVPGPQSTSFQLTGASRMDLAIRCTSSGGSVTLDGATIANLSTESGSTGSSSPFTGGSSWDPRGNLPSQHYLEDLSMTPADNFYNIQMTGGNINGATWPTMLTTMNYNDVQEWTISGSGSHPFHLHVYHMQVVDEGGCGHHEQWNWYDTISASGSCTVRFRMADYGGRVVLHCHFLRHEDNGAMTWIDVTGGPTIDTSNIDYCPGGTSPSAAPLSCVETGSSCGVDSDCCSGNCSNGNPSTRVCQ